MVHSSFRRSLRAWVRLWIPAGGLAVRAGRGSVVCGRHPALGEGRGCKGIVDPRVEFALFAANVFQHFRIDIAAADDGDVQFRLRNLIATEQEARHGYGTAGLGDRVGIGCQ